MNFWSDTINGWFLDEEELAKGDAADKANAEINRRLYEEGKMSPEDYALSQEQLGNLSSERMLSDPLISPGGGFEQSLNDSLDSVRGGINGVAAGTLAALWRAIPWWVWLGGAAYLAWRLGFLKFGK